MTLSLKEQYGSDCVVTTKTTASQCIVKLVLEGFTIDTFVFPKRAGRVYVNSKVPQTERGAAEHCAEYWFVRPTRKGA